MQEYIKLMDEIYDVFEQFQSLARQNVKEIQQLEQYQLTPQQELVMFYIIRREPVIAKNIAAHLNVSKSAVSQVLAKLEDGKLIQRRKNPENKTESLIELGKKGRQYAELLIHMDEQLVQKYYSKVSLAELETVHTILSQLLQAAKKEADHHGE